MVSKSPCQCDWRGVLFDEFRMLSPASNHDAGTLFGLRRLEPLQTYINRG